MEGREGEEEGRRGEVEGRRGDAEGRRGDVEGRRGEVEGRRGAGSRSSVGVASRRRGGAAGGSPTKVRKSPRLGEREKPVLSWDFSRTNNKL